MFSNQNQPNQFQQPNALFSPPVSLLSNQLTFNSPFGSTGRPFDTSPVSDNNLNKPQSNSVSGAPNTAIFGVPRNLFQPNSTQGSTSSIFGAPSMSSLAPESARNDFGTSIFAFPSTNNANGSGFPLFASTSSYLSSGLSGPQSTSAIPLPTGSSFSFSTPFQNTSSSATTSHSDRSSNSLCEFQSSGSQCKTTPCGIGSVIGKQCKGTSGVPYSGTRESNGTGGRNSLEKLQSISAMPVYSDRSHEELRIEDYQLLNKGNMFSNQNQPNQFQQPNALFSPPVSLLSNQLTFNSPFGSTGRPFDTSPVSDNNLNKPQSNSVSGAPNTAIFGVPRNLFQPNSTQGSTSSIFGAPSVSSLAPESARNDFGTSIFAFPSTNNAIGSGFPLFASTSSYLSSGLSGPQSTSAILLPTCSSFSFFTPLQNTSSSATTSHSDRSSNSLCEFQSSGSQCKTTPCGIGSVIGKQCKGTSGVPYSGTRESNGTGGRNSLEKLQSISAMPVYSDRSHEELRIEDYQLLNKGGNTPQSGQSGFKLFHTKENIFSRQAASNNVPAFNTLSNSPHFVTPAATSSTFFIGSHSFQPQSTVPSSASSFSSLNSFSTLNPVSQPIPSNNRAFAPISTTFLSSPFDKISSNKQSFTFASRQSTFPSQSTVTSSTTEFSPTLSSFSSLNPFTQSTTANNCLPSLSTTFTSSPFNTSSSEPSFTLTPFVHTAFQPLSTVMPSTAASTQSVNILSSLNPVNQSITSNNYCQIPKSSASLTSPLFSPSEPTISIQTGISSLAVSVNPSPGRKAPDLRIRYWSSRHNRYPAQRLNSGSKELKVPFFSDKPCTISPVMPRVNPRSWVSNLPPVKENAPPNTRGNGTDSSSKNAFATCYEIRIQEGGLDDLLPLLPKLRHGDYYTEPPIDLLAKNERAEPGSCSRVHDFVVGRRDYGSIKFLGETDVCGLDLESIIQFNKREVIVYLNGLEKPPVGQGLNKPAEVTLLDVKCINRKTGLQYTDGEKVHRYKAMLIKKTEEIGAEFVSYDPFEGVWKFRVQHF